MPFLSLASLNDDRKAMMERHKGVGGTVFLLNLETLCPDHDIPVFLDVVPTRRIPSLFLQVSDASFVIIPGMDDLQSLIGLSSLVTGILT